MTSSLAAFVFYGSTALMFIFAGVGAFLDVFPSKDFMVGVIKPYLRVAIPLALLWATAWSYSFVILKRLSTIAAQLLIGGGFFIETCVVGAVLVALFLQSINVWFDKSLPTTYRTRVVEKISQNGGRRGFTNIIVSNPQDDSRSLSLRVPQKVFNALEVEDEIRVTARAGRLGVEWIEKVENAEKLSFSG